MKTNWKNHLFAVVAMAVIGTLLHLFYDWSNQSVIIGMFSPINESVWEHMKMVFFPFLLISVIRRWYDKGHSNFWTAVSLSAVAALVALPVGYYFYTFFIEQQLWLDIGLFLLVAILQEYIFTCLLKKDGQLLIDNKIGILTIITIILSFIVFTFFPPQFELFRALSRRTI